MLQAPLVVSKCLLCSTFSAKLLGPTGLNSLAASFASQGLVRLQ